MIIKLTPTAQEYFPQELVEQLNLGFPREQPSGTRIYFVNYPCALQVLGVLTLMCTDERLPAEGWRCLHQIQTSIVYALRAAADEAESEAA